MRLEVRRRAKARRFEIAKIYGHETKNSKDIQGAKITP